MSFPRGSIKRGALKTPVKRLISLRECRSLLPSKFLRAHAWLTALAPPALCASRWPSMPTLLEELDVNDFTVDLHNAYSPGGAFSCPFPCTPARPLTRRLVLPPGHIPHHNSPIQSSRPGLDDSRITHPFEERLRSSWVPWLQGALKTVLWAMDSAVDRAQHHRAAADVSACENHHFENTDVNPCGCALCQQPRFEDNPPLELDVHTARGE